MAKTKKRHHLKDPSTPVAMDGDEFPTEITVELWHRPAKGKRALVGSRRYALTPDLPESTSVPESAAEAPPDTGGDATPTPKVARSAPARKRPRATRRATKPSA